MLIGACVYVYLCIRIVLPLRVGQDFLMSKNVWFQ